MRNTPDVTSCKPDRSPFSFALSRIPHETIKINIIYIYHSRFIPEEIAETSQIFLGDTDIYRLIAVHLGVSAVNPLVAFYDIRGRKGEVLFFCSVPDTIRD
jgi:hypothetical protein